MLLATCHECVLEY